MTKLVKLCPEIGALAKSVGQHVAFSGTRYGLVPSGLPLWDTKTRGPITERHLPQVLAEVRERVGRVQAAQSQPLDVRITKVCRLLSDVDWQPGMSWHVRSPALDVGTIHHGIGRWTARIAIVGERPIECHSKTDTFTGLVELARAEALGQLCGITTKE
jgi:hypothetical protein